MPMQLPKSDKKLTILLLLAVLILCGASYRYGRHMETRQQQRADLLAEPALAELLAAEEPDSGEPGGEDDSASAEPAEVLLAVHIKGAVAEPGLYYLPEGSRLADVLAEAGPLEDANTDLINLAAPLADSMEIVIPFRVADQETDWQALFETTTSGTLLASAEAADGEADGGLVNINTASLSRLQTLPGIGPVKAQAIIDYRENNGPFTSIEQITRVSGIGNATFESIRDRICVE